MSASYRHGTYVAYKDHGCRCTLCASYQNDRVRRNRAERLARVEQLTHGIRSTYDAGCRCTACRKCRSDASRRDSMAATKVYPS